MTSTQELLLTAELVTLRRELRAANDRWYASNRIIRKQEATLERVRALVRAVGSSFADQPTITARQLWDALENMPLPANDNGL